MGDIVKEWIRLINLVPKMLKTKPTDMVSNCCGEPPANEWYEEGEICSACGEHCDWEEITSEDIEQFKKDNDPTFTGRA